MSQAPLEIPAGERFMMPWRFYRSRNLITIELGIVALLVAAVINLVPLGLIVVLIIFHTVFDWNRPQFPLSALGECRIVVVSGTDLYLRIGSRWAVIAYVDVSKIDILSPFVGPHVLEIKVAKEVFHLPIIGEPGARLVHLVKAQTPLSAQTERAIHWVYTPRRGPLIPPSAEPWDELANVMADKQAPLPEVR